MLFPSNKTRNIDWADAPCNLKERQFVCTKKMCPGKVLINISSCYLLLFLGAPVSVAIAVTVAIVSVLVILVCVAVIAFILFRRSKKTKAEEPAEVDENPVYDMYYFADGDRIDYGNVEVEDENQMYGT